MYFTQEDYRKIENWLYKRSIKDNDLPIANSIKGNEKIPLLQDEENKISNIEDIAQYVGTTIIPDFYNITENNDDTSFKSLREALSKVPRSHQKLGLVITYRNINDKWCIFQFTSKSLSAWYNAAYWEDILQRGKPNGTASLDETGKIPMSQLPDNIGGGNNLELGETSTTAYPGDKGKKNADAINRLTNSLDSIDSYSKTTRNQLDAFKNTKGQALGIVPLDENGKVTSSYLPSYVDDVLEYNTRATFPTTGESGKIYIALDTNKTYRWGGTTYAELSSSVTLGETSSTAYAGDKGKKNREDINNLKNGLDSVANRLGKIGDKANNNLMAIEDLTTEVANTNTEVNTINGKISKLNTTIGDVRSSFNNYASAKTPIIDKVEPHIANKQNPHEVTKAQVGLSNVTNDAQVKRSEMGANNGIATLDANGKVLESQLPAAVTYAANLPDNIVEGGKATAAENGIILSLDTKNKENGSVSSKDILIPNADATKTDGSGLMLNSDKTKLNSIKALNTTFMTAIDDFVSNKQGLQMNYFYRNLKNNLGTGYITIPLASTTTNGMMSATDKVKLDSLSNYTLPTADSSTLGGIKIGSGLNIDSNGVVSVNNKLYILVNSLESVSTPDANKIYLVLNSSSTSETNSFTEYVWITSDTGSKWEKLGEASATVDLADYYTKTEINNKLSPINNSITDLDTNKVDKQDGKGLSTHDFNDSYKSYLDVLGNRSFGNSISYTSGYDEYKIHLRGMTGIVNDIETLSSITLPLATTSKCGLMSRTDKYKVDNALTFVPKAEPQVTGGVAAKIGDLDDAVNLNGPQPTVTYNYQRKLFMLEVDRNSFNDAFIPIPVPDVATTAKNGLLSKEDKTKLDGIATGANKYVLPEAGYNVLGGIKATNYSGAPAVGTINSKEINQKEVYGSFNYQSTMEQVLPTYYQVLEATTEKYGLMSPEDKVKLDSLSSGGSSTITEYTEAEITTLLKQIRF